MKTYVELGLAALLAVLVYEKPAFLVQMADSTLGILVMIVLVGVVAKQFGINAGLLGSVILILLLAMGFKVISPFLEDLIKFVRIVGAFYLMILGYLSFS